MNANRMLKFWFVALLLCVGLSSHARAQDDPSDVTPAPAAVAAPARTVIDESSVGGQILNPYSGEQITDRQPMIGVKLPQTDPPIDPASITIFVDGSDVTSETQISTEYIFYVPQIPLKLGLHNVRITYKDVEGNLMPPVEWSFTLVERISEQVVRPPVQQQVSTTGKLNLRFENIDLNKAVRPPTEPETDIRYRETFAMSPSYSFVHKFYGKTLKGNYQRSIEQITGRANDSIRFDYLDDNDDIVLGDLPITTGNYSELTMNGVQLRGIRSVKRLNPKYELTSFAGRTREPHSGRYKRYTTGFRVNTRTSKNHEMRFIVLSSKDKGLVTSTTAPMHDTIASMISNFTYNKNWKLNSEFVYDNHTERGSPTPTQIGKDSASKYFVTYNSTRVTTSVGRRTIGPRFTPTTLGTFTEADREGTYGSILYRPSTKFSIRTFYDDYHNNLHHNANTNNFTDKSTNSISSLDLNYPRLPIMNFRYGKLYTQTDAILGFASTQSSESTNANFSARRAFNDLGNWNGNSLVFVFSRYDIDRKAYASSGGTSTVFGLRSDTRNWTFTTRYKAFALFTYNTSYNKSFSDSTSSTPGSSSRSISTTKTNTDRYGVQLNIRPFKFITNLNYKRTAKKTYTTTFTNVTQTSLSAAPMEEQSMITFIYYLDQSRKLNLEYEDYDYEYRSPNNHYKSYDEQIVRLGYSLDF